MIAWIVAAFFAVLAAVQYAFARSWRKTAEGYLRDMEMWRQAYLQLGEVNGNPRGDSGATGLGSVRDLPSAG